MRQPPGGWKAKRYGRHFGKIDRWVPSSKLCSACGTIATSMPLNVRSRICRCFKRSERE
ncbi:zinc ribbon domain-containing protein [Streptosporangium sp. NBC_01469]|uniref:zinc ribbon domain-containing protein n=1 Tax=Streptosporangium sp. NBC_01469 TaxID=2903898 RepID=UPI002E2CD0AB|nr:zinc ribbon domain-containing protein [Streptosporangium sp. NBC_01469]